MNEVPGPETEPRPLTVGRPSPGTPEPTPPSSDADPTQRSAEPTVKPLPRWLLPSFTGITGIVIGAVGGFLLSTVSEVQTPHALTDAVEECELGYKRSAARIGDEGASLALNHQGEDEVGGISLAEVHCVLDALDVPDSVVAQMENTTAMDGRQSASWDGLTASWSYHPDRGIDIVFSLDQQG